METYNKFSVNYTSNLNANVACASTGKAAADLGGTTVHSAFKISPFKTDTISYEVSNLFTICYKHINTIFIDEYSLINPNLLMKIDL